MEYINVSFILSYFLILNHVSNILASVSGFYRDNGIDRTELVNQFSGRDQREMQHEILTLLGLHHRPKPKNIGSTRYSASQFMLQLYRNLTGEDGEGNDNEFRTNDTITLGSGVAEPVNGTDFIMSFINQANKKVHLRRQKDKTFFFDLTELNGKASALRAELRIFKEKADRWRKHQFAVQIYSIQQGNDPEAFEIVSQINKTITANYEGWIVLNLTQVANTWTETPSLNLGLFLKVIWLKKNKEVKPWKFGLVGRKGPKEKQPFMVGFFKSSEPLLHVRTTRSIVRRRRREAVYDDERTKYNILATPTRWPCQRKTLYMEFKELGWEDWIIAPVGYKAFYCEGECAFPLGAHMNATNHAIIQSLVHLWKPKEIPWPGCAPTKLASQSVLYFDEDSNVVLRRYPDMVVKSCGCH